jgi:hypothetical protein
MAAKFEDALDVRPLDDGRNWQVLEDFYYDTDVVLTPARSKDRLWPQGVEGWAHGWRVIVPKGFVTDFASIPRPLWAIVGGPADGKYRKAAVVHDFLYRTKGLATRPQADSVLLEAMKVSGCGWWERSIIYSGVRVGGSGSYKGGL